MATGDLVGSVELIGAGAILTIQPPGAEEWIVHNIYHEAEVELIVAEGSYTLLFASSSEKGSWSAYFFHLKNAHWMRVKNTNAASKLIGYDGIISK